MTRVRGRLLPFLSLFFIIGVTTSFAGTSGERGLVAAIEVSGDGRVMAVDYFADEAFYPIDFIDTATLELLGSVDKMQLGISRFALDYEGNRLIGTRSAGELSIYDRRDESITILRESGQFGSLGRIRWSPTDSSIIAYVFGGAVDFIDINTGKYLGSVNSNIGRVNDFAFHPSGNGIVTSVYVPGDSDFPAVFGVEIWGQFRQPGDVLHTPIITLEGRGGGSVAWSLDGRRIAMIEVAGLSIYNVPEQQFEATNLHTEPDTRPNMLAWSPDGQYIALNGENTSIWDATTYTFVRHVSEKASVRGIVWSPNGERIYGQNLGGPGGIGVFDAVISPIATPTPTLLPTVTPAITPTPSFTCMATIMASDSLALINAISAANANGASHDTICLAPDSTYTFSSASNSTALPSITTPITLVGNGSALERGSGAPNFRFFDVAASGNLTLEDLTLHNGNATGNNGGSILNAGALMLDTVTITGSRARYGGAIYSIGMLTLTDSTLTANTAQENAGALYASGAVSASDTVITVNNARYGGGVYLSSAAASLTDVTARGNTATERGAGIYQQGGSLSIASGLFEDNTARYGSGIYADSGTTSISDVSLTDNTATEEGAAIYNRASTLTVSDSIFTANDARYGAAISNRGPLTVMGTIFTDNTVRESGGAVYTMVAGANRIEGSCFAGNTGRFGGAVFSATANFDARQNWWGVASGPTGAMANNNVQFTPFLTDACPN